MPAKSAFPRMRGMKNKGQAGQSRELSAKKSEQSPRRVVANVACPGCGCLCDDLRITVAGDEVVSVEPQCSMANSWFFGHADRDAPAAEIDGRDAPLNDAVERAAAVLREAAYPLIYGLSRSATSGQRAAVALAEQLGAVVDSTASICHGPSLQAIQEMGESTCTLGEVRNRADLVIFWGCDPGNSHPRHAERYSVFPAGRFRPRGRRDRTIVMVGRSDRVDGWRLDPAGSRPDLVTPIEPGRDFEAIAVLRELLRGNRSAAATAELQRLFSLMQSCQWGIVFFGLGLAQSSMWAGEPASGVGHVNVAALLSLVAELNGPERRFFARRMRLQGDVSGADNVLCWQTGYPYAVNLSRGFPRYNPSEYAAQAMLERGEPDACLLVGAETIPYFSSEAQARLRDIPTIVLDHPGSQAPFVPHVAITTAVHGLHAEGVAYRMDNVPIGLRKIGPSSYPTDETVLERIQTAL